MPGLAVVIGPGDRQENEAVLQRMLRPMQHERYYVSGTYTDEDSQLYVAWSVHPGSYCDCLPITSDDGNLVLFVYGEHHTDDTAPSAAACATTARSLLPLIASQNVDALRKLNGWLHGVLLDRRRRRVLVFNDRAGMQRLYYHEAGDKSFFASEAKALLNAKAGLRELCPRGVADYLACGAVLENRTLFPKIATLPAASMWTFEHGSVRDRTVYFDRSEWETQPPLESSELEGTLESLLPSLIQRHARSRLPLAVSLTGGYDTRLIMAYLDRQQTNGASYTFGGIYRDCFDVKIARKVAATCGYSHRVLPIDSEFFATFPALAERTVYISDGNLGATNAYELYLNMRAREVAPVKMTGSFGSEVMRGSRAFKAQHTTPGLVSRDFEPAIDEAVTSFNETTRGNQLSFSVFKHAPWYYYNRLAIEQSQVIVRTPFLDNELVSLMYRVQGVTGDRRELTRRLIQHGNAALATMPTDTGNTSWLRYHILQFLFQADYCYKSGMPQWLEQLHYTFRILQPQRWFIGLHRFQHFRVWFRQQLASYVQEMLLDASTAARPYFNRPFVEHMVARHLKGDRNYTDDIERVLTIELTYRTLLETPHV
jgi:asparagine synthase (glutamine-hydrolysing)